jgi:transcription elongation factor
MSKVISRRRSVRKAKFGDVFVMRRPGMPTLAVMATGPADGHYWNGVALHGWKGGVEFIEDWIVDNDWQWVEA